MENQDDLFDHAALAENARRRPLADRMRPARLDDFMGQPHLSNAEALIRNAISRDRIFSMILWGPPGCGKTSLANIIAHETNSYFVRISAVLSGVKDIRDVIDEARRQLKIHHRRTILFVDEIHRFNKAQQDAFLKHVEEGLITLIGATTENPSFEVIPALLSRCRLITLNPLQPGDIAKIVQRALTDGENGLGTMGFQLSPEALDHLVSIADGDVRTALNSLEIVSDILAGDPGFDRAATVSLAFVEKILNRKALLYDKGGEEHYNLISAFHKSLRGSDPDAGLYWLARMLDGGEDPFFIARRMVRFASEDIGNADPYALHMALNAMEAFRFLGHPEGELALAHAAVYLATAPKSNAVYAALNRVHREIKQTGYLPTPLHIRNAPTKIMETLGYGEGYKYAHDYEDAFTPQSYLPGEIQGRLFYRPSERGYEKTVKQRLDRWRECMKTGSRSSHVGPGGPSGDSVE